MVLDLRLFEVVLEKAAGDGPLPDMTNEFAPHLAKRELALVCPREEILVSPSPSFIFVMNEELLGVYPTPTGVYIRKPLERGEEVMVLQPGFKGKAVYYYDRAKCLLFALSDVNRKLIYYDLNTGTESTGVTLEVSGLPGSRDHVRETKTSLACTDNFVFVLFDPGHLFCIDRLVNSEWGQAKLIQPAEPAGRLSCLMVNDEDPLSAQVVSHCKDELSLYTYKLRSRHEPLSFRAVETSFASTELNSVSEVHFLDESTRVAVTKYQNRGPRGLTLCDDMLRSVGNTWYLRRSDSHISGGRGRQFACGHKDVVYCIEDDPYFGNSYDYDDVSDDELEDLGCSRRRNASTTSSSDSTDNGEPRLPLGMEIALKSKSLVTMMKVRRQELSVMDDLWRTCSMLNRREMRPGINADIDTLRVENITWRMRNKWKSHAPSEEDFDGEDNAGPVNESCKGLLGVLRDHTDDMEVETNRIIAGASFPSTSLSTVFHHDRYHGFLFDMDGVLHQCEHAIPGAGEFITRLNAGQIPYMLLTNECRYTTEELSLKLLGILGVNIRESQIYTAANSAADFFARLISNGWTGVVFIIGEFGLVSTVRQAFVKHGLSEDSVITGDTSRSRSPKEVDYVLIGSVHSENTRYVERACSCVQEGARLLYTCPDYYEVTPDGSYKFGMPMPAVEMISKVTNADSYNLGKPNPHMLRMARQRLLSQRMRGRSPALGPVLFVGDSLGTDIRTAIENGIDCALVMSGCTDEQQLKKSPLLPNFVFASIKELMVAYATGSLVPCSAEASSSAPAVSALNQ
ncbi:hypothetical protein FOL47_009590 [Perkinsus chesapeaki]|uniref:Uncharacterized protein n=1 Tax=Perkinsus chesapeaki TaxID=330153 RepID=A0A7J6MRQ7_PERCH|nr:hypothetical protein FOL47_009590 [Perkinsus chesapeaki]